MAYEEVTTTTTQTQITGDITPGDLVSVNHERYGRREGLVVGQYMDYAGRQIVEVQLEPHEIYQAWYPTVTRVKRTVSYARPQIARPRERTVERRIYW